MGNGRVGDGQVSNGRVSGRRKPRAAKRRLAGTYPIDTGEATIVADPDRDGAYVLEVNRVPSSYVVPDAPEVLGFDYTRWIAGFAESWWAGSGAGSVAGSGAGAGAAVHLGAAGCALPSYFAHRFGNRNVAVEVDAGLADLVARTFSPDAEIVVAEARAFTHAVARGTGTGTAAFVVCDVFSGPDTPRPLTTVEFFRAARGCLAPGGLYVANVGDRPGLPNTREELAGLAEVFAYTAAAAPSEMLDGRGYGNVVVAASDRPLAFDAEACGGVSVRDGGSLIGGARPRFD